MCNKCYITSTSLETVSISILARLCFKHKQHMNKMLDLNIIFLVLISFQEFVYEDLEDRNISPRMSMSSSLQSFYMSYKGHHNFTTPAVTPSCSVQTLNNVGYKSFREFLLMTLPLIVHPVIILRLLAHKMFGNMIRRKNIRSQDTKLKPPKEDISNAEIKCPPRSNSESSKYFEQRMQQKNAKLAMESQSRANTNGSSNNKHNNNSNMNSEQLGTNLAIKAIGESLVTPLEMHIHSRTGAVPEHKPLCASQSESLRGSKPKLFRWQSKKHLSKSQVSLTMSPDEPFVIKVEAKESNNDVDIVAFQRELINLPTFVMDTPLDISPVFSRSSSVPENLAGRLNPTLGSLCQISVHSSRKRLSKSGCGSDQAVSSLVHAGSTVAITMTDPNHKNSVFFLPSEDSTTNTPDDSMANIIVHFDPPQSPLLSSASGSPHGFDFSNVTTGSRNFLQPGSVTNNTVNGNLNSVSSVKQGSLEEPRLVKALSEANIESSASKTSLSRPDMLRISPMASPINEMPIAHQAVLKVIETWITVCPTDLEGAQLVVLEMRDFLKKLSVLGTEYKVWCQKILNELQLEVS